MILSWEQIIKVLYSYGHKSVSISSHTLYIPPPVSVFFHVKRLLSFAVNNEVVTISSDTCSTVGSASTRNGSVSQISQSIIDLDFSPTSMSSSQSSVSGNEPTTSTTRVGSSSSGSFAGRLASLGSGIARSTSRTSQVGEPSCKRNGKFTSLEESQDPFAFDLEDSKPSKWAVVSVKQKKSRAQKKKGCLKESKDTRLYQLFSSQEESSNRRLDSQEETTDRDCAILQQPSSSTNDIDEECLCLLSDCLLTTVKVNFLTVS